MVSSFVSERAARKIAIAEKDVVKKSNDRIERILIPVSNPENIQRLIDFALLIKDDNSQEPIYPLSIVEDDEDADEKINVVRKVIEGVVEQIASGDSKVEVLKKVDLSIVDGIARTAKAYNITDIIISYKAQQGTGNFMFGSIADNLLTKSKQSIIISKIIQPLNTYQRVKIVLSPNAELENGFYRAVQNINKIARQVGDEVSVFGTNATIKAFSSVINDRKRSFFKYTETEDFKESKIINEVQEDDLFVFLSARKQTISYDFHVDDMPKLLNRNNEFTSFTVVYPELSKALTDGRLSDIAAPSIEQNFEKVKRLTDRLKGLFSGKS